MNERALFIFVMKCSCGKVHCAAGITYTSVCTCGRNLHNELMYWIGGRRKEGFSR